MKKTIYRKDYQPCGYGIKSVYCQFSLHSSKTIVTTKLVIQKLTDTQAPLVLNGEHLQLLSVKINGQETTDYQKTDSTLTLANIQDNTKLEITTEINPEANKALEGLYISNNVFCTQCEPEGFRRITYYLDRPDVLSSFTVRIEADKKTYPVLLSNGNLMENGELASGRHFALWHDPHKKPCYLFALVAGDLDVLSESFTTCSSKEVALNIYVEKGKVSKAHQAMLALKKSMAWDEKAYGREYDLDIFNIVSVSDFVMGAMENKSLNIFNDKYILADSKTATDTDYENIDRVVGHEYFHNWTGNRVTCRSWFELCLKEGLTVFREQSFMETVRDAAVSRIEDVNLLKSRQFPEDGGPLSHPARPDQYQEINNFYTMTVYEKGSEIFRMLANLVGKQGFRAAMDAYFERFDGQAATVDDVVDIVQEVNQVDLSQFRLWYSQSGTPEIFAEGHYDVDTKQFSLVLKQICKPTADQAEKQPLLIPVSMGLISETGDVLLENQVLRLSESCQTFTFQNITQKPIPSMLRHFSAPVKLHYAYSESDLTSLALHDADDFNRWQAVQTYAIRTIVALMNQNDALVKPFCHLIQNLIQNTHQKTRLLAKCLQLPVETELLDYFEQVDSDALNDARELLIKQLAKHCEADFIACYENLSKAEGDYQYEKSAVANRSLKNICLYYITATKNQSGLDAAYEQFHSASNMTDQFAALQALNNIDCNQRSQTLKAFYDKWQQEHLVVNKWLSLQASSLKASVSDIKTLMAHAAFDIKNPNKVYALLLQFAIGNFKNFHHISGDAYQFIAEQVLSIDQFNPQVAGRLVQAFSGWRCIDTKRQSLMQAALKEIKACKNLSSDVAELVAKMLA